MELLVGEDLPSSYRAPRGAERPVVAEGDAGPLVHRQLRRKRARVGYAPPAISISRDATSIYRRLAPRERADRPRGALRGYVDPPPFAEGQLEQLILTTCNVHDAGARILFAAKNLAALVELDLAESARRQRDAPGAARDDEPPAPRALRQQLARSLGALAGWDVLAKLEQLAVPQSITSDALGALFPNVARAPRAWISAARSHSPRRRTRSQRGGVLHVARSRGTSLGDAGWRALVTAPSLRSVMHLPANGCSLSGRRRRRARESKLGRLVTLDLSSNKLTDASLRALAGWPGSRTSSTSIGNNKSSPPRAAGAHRRAPISACGARRREESQPIVDRLRERYGDVVLAKA